MIKSSLDKLVFRALMHCTSVSRKIKLDTWAQTEEEILRLAKFKQPFLHKYIFATSAHVFLLSINGPDDWGPGALT